MGKENNRFTPVYFGGGQQDCENHAWDNGCEAEAARTGDCACSGNSGRKGDQPSGINETHVYFEPCDGAQVVCITGTCENQQMLGRVLDVTATLQNVCPGRRSAVGLTLNEVDENGAEYARGFRALSVPAHHGSCSRDMQLETVRFILPEDMSLQRRRHFICRISHHYLDADSLWG